MFRIDNCCDVFFSKRIAKDVFGEIKKTSNEGLKADVLRRLIVDYKSYLQHRHGETFPSSQTSFLSLEDFLSGDDSWKGAVASTIRQEPGFGGSIVASHPTEVRYSQDTVLSNCEGWYGSSGGGYFNNGKLIGITIGMKNSFAAIFRRWGNIGWMSHLLVDVREFN